MEWTSSKEAWGEAMTQQHTQDSEGSTAKVPLLMTINDLVDMRGVASARARQHMVTLNAWVASDKFTAAPSGARKVQLEPTVEEPDDVEEVDRMMLTLNLTAGSTMIKERILQKEDGCYINISRA